MSAKHWFEVDKEGLATLMERRGVSFVLFELLQNAYDEKPSQVKVTLEPIEGRRGRARLVVEDDSPDGFLNLRDSWTLFARSYKAKNPEKRGRFNLGEKLVLSLCEEAEIRSTQGGVRFDAEGRHTLRKKRESGTVFDAIVKLTRPQVEEIEQAMDLLIPSVPTTFNGRELFCPEPITTTDAVAMQTEYSDEEGLLRRSVRLTKIRIFEPLTEDGGWIYEMGIPICSTGDRFSADVLQTVPLSIERDNVPPSFLKRLRAHVLNATAELLSEDDASSSWVKEATGAKECEAESMDKVLDKTHGEKRFMWDPGNPEAGKDLISQGYTPVYGNQLSTEQRSNVRSYRDNGRDLAVSASKLTRAGQGAYSDDPSASPVDIVSEGNWTPGMQRVVGYAKHSAGVLGVTKFLTVRIVKSRSLPWSAAYGSGTLDFNLSRVGHAFFNGSSGDALQRVNNLLLHEFGHQYSSDHLSSEFHRALTKLGAKLTRAALEGGLKPKDYNYEG